MGWQGRIAGTGNGRASGSPGGLFAGASAEADFAALGSAALGGGALTSGARRWSGPQPRLGACARRRRRHNGCKARRALARLRTAIWHALRYDLGQALARRWPRGWGVRRRHHRRPCRSDRGLASGRRRRGRSEPKPRGRAQPLPLLWPLLAPRGAAGKPPRSNGARTKGAGGPGGFAGVGPCAAGHVGFACGKCGRTASAAGGVVAGDGGTGARAVVARPAASAARAAGVGFAAPRRALARGERPVAGAVCAGRQARSARAFSGAPEPAALAAGSAPRRTGSAAAMAAGCPLSWRQTAVAARVRWGRRRHRRCRLGGGGSEAAELDTLASTVASASGGTRALSMPAWSGAGGTGLPASAPSLTVQSLQRTIAICCLRRRAKEGMQQHVPDRQCNIRKIWGKHGIQPTT
mgnify:CR=1 FL=1